jgi:cytochrome P450
MTEPIAFLTMAPGSSRVCGHADARAVLADPRFVHWLRRDGAPTPVAAAIARWLDAMDPRHGHPARATVIRALSPAASNAARPALERRAEALLEAIPANAAFNIESGFARPLTHALVFDVLGVDEASRSALDPLLEALAMHVPRALFPMPDQPYDAAVFDAWERMLAAAASADGLAAVLRDDLAAANAPDDFGPFTAMFAFAATGNITRFIARAGHGLAAQRELWPTLYEQPGAVAAALEEWLRYDPPLPFVHLIASEPVADGTIKPGDSVLVALSEANRDPAAFAMPDDFAPGRRAQHLAFGSGPLTCIGAAVARMLARVAIGRLVAISEPGEGEPLPFPLVRLARRVQARGVSADAIT